MAIWIPNKLYHVLPLLCLLIGVLFLCIGVGFSNFVLSVLLIGYGCGTILVRLSAFWE